MVKQSKIYLDNQSVFLNSTVPGIGLNQKEVVLSYHLVREHNANNVVNVYKMKSEDNYSEPLTKRMNSTNHGIFFHNIMHN